MLDGVYFFVQNQKMKHRLRTCQFVHMMFNDKFCAPFVDFLNRNFNPDEHLVICKRWFKEHPFPHGSNVIEVKNLKHIDFSHKNIKKVICHSLFDGELVQYLYEHSDILKEKVYWHIWGGDLYEATRDEKNDFVRSNFKGYMTNSDRYFLEKNYGTNKNFFKIMCPFPISIELIKNAKITPHDYIQVQINNSADKTTLEMLDILAKFKDENIKVTTILSYGQMEYKDEIIKKGKEIFDEKFIPILNYMKPQDYVVHLVNNDILILNQHRQQGFGNTLASLLLGKKVFIRDEILLGQWHKKEDDIDIYKTESIEDLTFSKFIKNDSKEKNKRNAEKYATEEYPAELWEAVLNAK